MKLNTDERDLMSKSENTLIDFTPVDDLSYEQAFEELEEVTKSLELHEHSLDQAVALFERGQALILYCTKLIDQAEIKVQQIQEQSLTLIPEED